MRTEKTTYHRVEVQDYKLDRGWGAMAEHRNVMVLWGCRVKPEVTKGPRLVDGIGCHPREECGVCVSASAACLWHWHPVRTELVGFTWVSGGAHTVTSVAPAHSVLLTVAAVTK